MEPAILTALSAILGSAVGGSATLATAWLMQRTQGRRERVETEVRKREQLYVEFIAESSKLFIEGFEHAAPRRCWPQPKGPPPGSSSATWAPTCRRRSCAGPCSLRPTIPSRTSAKPVDPNSRSSNAEVDLPALRRPSVRRDRPVTCPRSRSSTAARPG